MWLKFDVAEVGQRSGCRDTSTDLQRTNRPPSLRSQYRVARRAAQPAAQPGRDLNNRLLALVMKSDDRPWPEPVRFRLKRQHRTARSRKGRNGSKPSGVRI